MNSKLKEALEAVKNAMALGLIGAVGNYPNEDLRSKVANITYKIDAALAEPPRNCDVGDAKEQAERFFNFCDGYMYATGYKSCGTCPLWTSGCVGHDCELRWAQMPYDEGVTK